MTRSGHGLPARRPQAVAAAVPLLRWLHDRLGVASTTPTSSSRSPARSHSRRPTRLDGRRLGEGRRDGAAQGHRLRDEDPDAAVWARLTRQTLDGIDITPLGTPDLLEGLVTHGRPPAGRSLGVRRRGATNARGRSRRPRRWAAPPCGCEPDRPPSWARLLDGVELDLAPGRPRRRRLPRAFLAYADGRELAPGTNLGSRRRAPRPASRPPLATRAGVLGFVVDATVVHDHGRLRRPGARLCDDRRRAVAACAHRRRRSGRRGGGPARVPPGGDRRAVPVDRQAASGAPAVGAGARAQRRRVAADAPARRDEPADDEPLRPLGEHAAHHGRRVRRRCRWRGRGHRAALRRPARRARRLRRAGSRATPARCWSPSRTSPASPTLPGAPTPSRSSPTISLSLAGTLFGAARRRLPTWAARCRVGRDRGRARPAGRRRGSRPITGLSEFPNLAETLPTRARPATVERCAATALRSRRCATPSRPPRRSSWRPWARSPRTPPEPGSRPTCWPPAASPSTGPAPPTGSTDLVAAYDGQRGGVPGRHRRGVRRVGRGGCAALREAGATRVVVAGKPADSGRRLVRAGGRRGRLPDPDQRGSCHDASRRASPGCRWSASTAGLRGTDGRGRDSSTTGGRRAVAEPGGHRDPAGLRPERPRGPRRARHLAGPQPVPARALPDDVHHPAVDDPAVRRLLDRRGVQRVLPAQPGGRAEGAQRRLRPRHPPRLRLRPPAGARRRRHGRASPSTRSTTRARSSTASRWTR